MSAGLRHDWRAGFGPYYGARRYNATSLRGAAAMIGINTITNR